ncbi:MULTISPECIES: hypothetical protein [Nonomuraea]|jgi:hypothetical protein|uniref:Uncharacterized protein n=2 Tax=Nonomuraea TaxID=83681 RepID=A0A7W5VIP0_9ACTN|nr:hypothetical protein [Nonomuraea dietziae]MBB3732810.1 hypothetical protein [Nonomuraea dietziae]
MADFDPPTDLLELKRAFNVIDARCEEISAALPSNVAVLEGKAEFDVERQAELVEARSDRLRLVEEINRHPWWSAVDDRHAAWRALHQAAQS